MLYLRRFDFLSINEEALARGFPLFCVFILKKILTKSFTVSIIDYGFKIPVQYTVAEGCSVVLDVRQTFTDESYEISVKEALDFSASVGDCFREPVSADINVKNHAGVVVLTASVRFKYYYECDRCTVKSEKDFAYIFRHILVTSLSDESGDDYIEAPDYKLDTGSLLRDDILLELPSKLLCKEDCKGLCPKCGKNLNEGDCGCSTREIDPRLAALRALLSE